MDRILLKAAGIIAMVVGILLSITIIGMIVGIPLIVMGNSTNKMANFASDEVLIEQRGTILVYSIIFFFFAGFVPGILGLLFYLQLYNISGGTIFTNRHDDITTKIRELEKLRKDNLITDEEFEKSKKKILNID